MKLRLCPARLFAPFTRSLGTCPKFMHTAFVAALIANCLAVAAIVILSPFAAAIVWLAALLLALLWLAHIFAFALRWIAVQW